MDHLLRTDGKEVEEVAEKVGQVLLREVVVVVVVVVVDGKVLREEVADGKNLLEVAMNGKDLPVVVTEVEEVGTKKAVATTTSHLIINR